MKPYYVRFPEWVVDTLDRAVSPPERRAYLKAVPRTCRRCSDLDLCRDGARGWKCVHGALCFVGISSGEYHPANKQLRRTYVGKWIRRKK